MCVFEPSDSKILFNLWGWLWLPKGRSAGRVGNSASRFYGRSTGSSYWYFMKIESDSRVSQ
ncbi:hypothetical protein B1J93_12140 [Leptospira kirschneri serovar Pomona]|uniref:Uncharacterized protein n=1 Tax=Leptospira kirschneri serovar Pomona TaxID=561005 RepID=A0A1T1DLH9_9LEPT|nr:hypothetical protein B1J93_12140 [Leptospira kirschneri serovar Pomona]